MPKTEAQKRATAKYDKATYDEIKFKPRKDVGARVRAHAAERYKSLNEFLLTACETQIALDEQAEAERYYEIMRMAAERTEAMQAEGDLPQGKPKRKKK